MYKVVYKLVHVKYDILQIQYDLKNKNDVQIHHIEMNTSIHHINTPQHTSLTNMPSKTDQVPRDRHELSMLE